MNTQPEPYGVCRKCGDELPMRDLSESKLCIECRYELEKQMPDPDEAPE